MATWGSWLRLLSTRLRRACPCRTWLCIPANLDRFCSSRGSAKGKWHPQLARRQLRAPRHPPVQYPTCARAVMGCLITATSKRSECALTQSAEEARAHTRKPRRGRPHRSRKRQHPSRENGAAARCICGRASQGAARRADAARGAQKHPPPRGRCYARFHAERLGVGGGRPRWPGRPTGPPRPGNRNLSCFGAAKGTETAVHLEECKGLGLGLAGGSQRYCGCGG